MKVLNLSLSTIDGYNFVEHDVSCITYNGEIIARMLTGSADTRKTNAFLKNPASKGCHLLDSGSDIGVEWVFCVDDKGFFYHVFYARKLKLVAVVINEISEESARECFKRLRATVSNSSGD